MQLIRKHKIAKYALATLLLLVIGLSGVSPAYALSCSDVPSDQQQACSDAQASAQNYCNSAPSDQQQNCSDSISNCGTQSSASAYIGCLNQIASTNSGTKSGTPPSQCSNANDCKIDPGTQLNSDCQGSTAADGVACSKIFTGFIDPLIKFLAIGVGVIVVIMVIVGGVQYATSAGNPQAAANARKRILNAILAFVVFIFLYALLNWIVPGGVPLP